jgi:hypothetical protein
MLSRYLVRRAENLNKIVPMVLLILGISWRSYMALLFVRLLPYLVGWRPNRFAKWLPAMTTMGTFGGSLVYSIRWENQMGKQRAGR